MVFSWFSLVSWLPVAYMALWFRIQTWFRIQASTQLRIRAWLKGCVRPLSSLIVSSFTLCLTLCLSLITAPSHCAHKRTHAPVTTRTSTPSPSQNPKSTNPPSREQAFQATLAPFNQFLNHTRTLSAQIEQSSARDAVIAGTIALDRTKGQLLIRYANGRLLVPDGKRLIQYDSKNKALDTVDVQDTPLCFLLRPGNIQDIALVEKVILRDRYTHILLRNKKDPEAGTVELIFLMQKTKPIALISWILTEANGKRIDVRLKNWRLNSVLPLDIFKP
jgi:outer membrane lipoprotein-sorting protein